MMHIHILGQPPEEPQPLFPQKRRAEKNNPRRRKIASFIGFHNRPQNTAQMTVRRIGMKHPAPEPPLPRLRRPKPPPARTASPG